MEVQFGKKTLSYLDPVVREVRSAEQTQEIKLPDSMPDIGRIIAAWGQGILRGKEWRGGEMCLSGGLMVWVLYAPEDGTRETCIDTWIPFQLRWDLPGDLPDGRMRMLCMPKFVDARNVSPRKIMVRAGLSALGEAWVPRTAEVFAPEEPIPGMELLQKTYPVRLNREAGEKAFQMEEELILPPSAPQPEGVVYYRMEPKLTDKKVLGNKIVFRGSGNLHTLYRSEEGQLHSWDFELPFSQYSELDLEHGTDAQAELLLSPTGLELSLDDEGHMHLKAGITAQYLISDREKLSLTEDAYSPGREVQLQKQELTLPVLLDSRRENFYGEQTLPVPANVAADVSVSPEFPRQRRNGDEITLESPGMFQVLYYGEDGLLRSGTARWEDNRVIPADENSQIVAFPTPSQPQANALRDQIQMKAEIPMELSAAARQGLPMVTGLQLGEPIQPDPNRPSLILRRAGEDGLWSIAKGTGSTLEAIRRANNLQNEPDPNQILLIPVP